MRDGAGKASSSLASRASAAGSGTGGSWIGLEYHRLEGSGRGMASRSAARDAASIQLSLDF